MNLEELLRQVIITRQELNILDFLIYLGLGYYVLRSIYRDKLNGFRLSLAFILALLSFEKLLVVVRRVLILTDTLITELDLIIFLLAVWLSLARYNYLFKFVYELKKGSEHAAADNSGHTRKETPEHNDSSHSNQ